MFIEEKIDYPLFLLSSYLGIRKISHRREVKIRFHHIKFMSFVYFRFSR